ncbi:hypothetical protein [Campylobacter magnus]|nr:hypothetical protein [Campylobacter magnus]MDD0856128.1 hypothetical protein [Campylobacter magnus]
MMRLLRFARNDGYFRILEFFVMRLLRFARNDGILRNSRIP